MEKNLGLACCIVVPLISHEKFKSAAPMVLCDLPTCLPCKGVNSVMMWTGTCRGAVLDLLPCAWLDV